MQTAASSALAAFQDRDVRADGASRHVAVDGERVSIARRYQGIDMRVAVPVSAYAGVVLRSAVCDKGIAYEVRLAHRDPDLSVTLCEAADDAEGQSAWRSWAQYLKLPALVEAETCEAEPMPWARRNRGVSANRRPRFLTRRKIGAGPMETVHREDEIISYE